MPKPSRYAPDTLPRARHWTDTAACQDIPTPVFFPVSEGGVPAEFEAEYAKSFCRICPVKAECLAHALTYREDFGVWGGLDEKEREALRDKARREAENRRRREREREQARATTNV